MAKNTPLVIAEKLIRNVLVMYDRQTESLWSQLLGEAVQGPLVEMKLEFLPAFQTTCEDWKNQHPDNLALRKGYYESRDPYSSYYISGQKGVIGEAISDERLHTKEFVVGVEYQDVAVAFPFSVLNSEPVVNHEIGDKAILVVFNVKTGTGIVCSRNLDGQILTFEDVEDLILRIRKLDQSGMD